MSGQLSVNEAKAIVASTTQQQEINISVVAEENNGFCVVFRHKNTGNLLWKLNSSQLAEFKIDFAAELKKKLEALPSILVSNRFCL